MYKSKLYLVLKTLGVQNIEELMEKESPYLVRVALEIREAAEIGGFFSASQPVIETDAEGAAECKYYPECVYITELCDNCGRTA